MPEQIDGRRLRYQHRRSELLDAVGEYALDHGIASLSLRRVAKDVGVSHATLQHHFGSKEELVDEIVDHLLERTLVPRPGAPLMRDLWAGWTSPTGRRDIRLFFEIVGQSLFDEPGYAGTVKRSIESRISALAATMTDQGCPPADASAVATLMIAGFRGLLTDLLVTGDEQRVGAAFELFVAAGRQLVISWNQPSLVPDPAAVLPHAKSA